MTIDMKSCRKCHETKPLDDFHRDKGRKDGRDTKCRACANKHGAVPNPPKHPTKKGICQHCGICFSFRFGGWNIEKGSGGKFCSIYCHHADRSARKKPYEKPVKTFCKISFDVCKWCGKTYTKHGGNEYCSAECRRELSCAVSHAKDRLSNGPKKPFNCKECDAIFTPQYQNTNSVFCSAACAKKHHHRIGKLNRETKKRKAFVESVDPLRVFKRDGYRCGLCGRKTIRSKRGTEHPKAPELDHIIPLSKGGEHSYRNTQCSCRSCNGGKGNRSIGQLRLFG